MASERVMELTRKEKLKIFMQKIVLGTPLAPFDFEKKIIAVKSWIKNGFHVVSCNAKKEIEILEKIFYDFEIEFVE